MFLSVLKIICKILLKSPLPIVIKIKINDFYHKCIFSKIKIYLKRATNYINFNNINNNSGRVWILWWQGESNMPLIVRRCVESIYRHANGHIITLIDKNNVKNYANLPNYIYHKIDEGRISLTHFSDILRFNLLNKYGGLWVDSTIYCSSNLKNNMFSKFYTSGGYPNIYHQYISAKWTGFLIGGCRHNVIFQFMDTFFKIYWRYNNVLIDYFLIDYALKYVYCKNIGGFKDYVNNEAFLNNPHLYSLVGLLNCKYNSKKYNQITDDTNMFKLTYKKEFNNNCNTFYNRLINNKL